MGPQIIWLFFSYGIVFSIAMAIVESGHQEIGLALAFLFPAIRVARRFREQGGYRLMGGAGVVSGSLSQRGGFATRRGAPFFFWLCFGFEIVAIGGFVVHSLFR